MKILVINAGELRLCKGSILVIVYGGQRESLLAKGLCERIGIDGRLFI